MCMDRKIKQIKMIQVKKLLGTRNLETSLVWQGCTCKPHPVELLMLVPKFKALLRKATAYDIMDG